MVEISNQAKQGENTETPGKIPFDSDEATRIVGTLSRIQELSHYSDDSVRLKCLSFLVQFQSLNGNINESFASFDKL